MASKAGLRKVTKTVRGKKGAVKRSYWVRAKEGVKGFVKRHPTAVKVGLGAAGALAAGLAIHKGLKLDRRVRASKQQTHEAFQKTRESIGSVGHAMKNAQASASAVTATRNDVSKSLRRTSAEVRRAESEMRRLNAAERRIERGDKEGASNILNRQSHLNMQRSRKKKMN